MSQQEDIHSYNQEQHKLLLNALHVHVERDINGHPVTYSDKFGEEGYIMYNQFRGHKHGEGHADRILDHYLDCIKLEGSLKCKFSEEYMEFLRKERNYGYVAPALSLRARLLRVI